MNGEGALTVGISACVCGRWAMRVVTPLLHAINRLAPLLGRERGVCWAQAVVDWALRRLRVEVETEGGGTHVVRASELTEIKVEVADHG